MQTGNLVRGETTCERYGKFSYRQMHTMHKENMSLEQSYEVTVKSRKSIMSIDASTNPSNAICGNLVGMCCNQQVMEQKQLLEQVQENYEAEGYETSVNESTFNSPDKVRNDNSSIASPLIDKRYREI